MRLFARSRRALLTGAAVTALLLPGVVGVLPASAQSTTGPETAQAAPEGTVFFLSVNLDDTSAQGMQAQELLSRMGLDDALDQGHQAFLDDPSNNGQVTEADLDALLGGEMAIVVLPQAVDNLRELGEAAIEVAESPMMATPGALDDPATGDAFANALATPIAGFPEQGFGIGAVLEPSDIDGAWSYVEQQMRQSADKAGGEVEEVDYNGTTILIAPDSNIYGMDMDFAELGEPDDSADMDATPMAEDDLDLDEEDSSGDHSPMDMGMGDYEGRVATARAGDFIIAAATRADVETMIDVAMGDTPSLAESDDLAAVQDALGADESLMFGYTNGPALYDGLGDDLTSRLTALSAAMYPTMDMEAYQQASQGIVIWADAPGLRIDTVTLRSDGEPLPAMVPNAGTIDFAEKVPDNTILYNAGFIGPQVLAALPLAFAPQINQMNGMMGGETSDPQTLDDVLVMFQPGYYEEQLAAAEQVLGFNLKSDFTDLLTGEFGLAIGSPQLSGSEFGIDAIVSLDSSDPDALATTVQKIARSAENAAAGALTARKQGTDTVYVIQVPDAAGVPAFEFGVVDTELLAGTDSGLSSYQNGPNASLADDEQFQTVMGLLPDDGYQEGYVNLGQIIEVVLAFSGMATPATQLDASIGCADYGDQAEAQVALEEDAIDSAGLDSDFDGQACEDFFSAASTPVATGGPANVRALGLVAWERDGMQGSNTLLYVADDGS